MPLVIASGCEQTIYQAAQWRAELEQALRADGDGDIELDLSTVEEFDCAGAQVLLWLLREGERRGQRVALRAPSRCIRDFVRLMGLNELALPAEGDGDGS
ncbi:STAS domain-containing protein [Chromobacterium sp. CV08]|uniref:STAS domain-containing protein n=1 Tax=Chromobacterium sp. CV08 TaxID=3133274 RepID=UPI003DA93C6F